MRMSEQKTEKQGINRRQFISRSGALTAAVSAAAVAGPAINVLGANDVIRVGVIGPGKRGKYLMEMATQAVTRNELNEDISMQFVAVADIYEGWREEGAARGERFNMILENEGEVKQYDHHKKMLEDKDVDAVIIATPEHQHYAQLIDSIQAGKDVYCEKPMVQNIKQGLEVLKAFKSSDRIVQIGTQRRSVPLYRQANEMVKNGDIGQVTFCEGWWNRNEPDGQPGPWAYEIPDDASPDNIAWEEFFYDAPKTEFNKQRYFQWRSFWDYSNGIGSDLMVHQIDAICMVMGVGVPQSIVSSGGLYRWKDGRTTPDTWSCIMEFEEGFQVNYHARFSNICRPNDRYTIQAEIDHKCKDNEKKREICSKALKTLVDGKILDEKIQDYGIRVCGSKGLIEVFCHWDMNVWPEPNWLWGSANKLAFQNYKYGDSQPQANDQAVRDHMQNWLECVITRKQPNCTVKEGFDGAVISNMGTLSYMEGRKIIWDKEKMEARPA